jgi:hypothetical protein
MVEEKITKIGIKFFKIMFFVIKFFKLDFFSKNCFIKKIKQTIVIERKKRYADK